MIPEGEKITPFQQLLQAAVRPSPDALSRELDHLEQVRTLIPEALDLSDLPHSLTLRLCGEVMTLLLDPAIPDEKVRAEIFQRYPRGARSPKLKPPNRSSYWLA